MGLVTFCKDCAAGTAGDVMTEARFYVELPAGEYGNTALPTAVIEAELTQDPETRRPKLTIHAPAEIAERWPTRYADFYNGYAETEGPARMLDREEYDALIERIRETTGELA